MQPSILVVEVNEDSTNFFLADIEDVDEETMGILRSGNAESVQEVIERDFSKVSLPLRGQNIAFVYQVVTF